MASSNKSSLISPDAIPAVGLDKSYIDFQSPAALHKYVQQLHKLRKGPKPTPRYRLGQPISLPNVPSQRPSGDGRIPSRPPPRFRQSHGDNEPALFAGDLVFRTAVQRPPIGGIHVWIVDVVALGDKKGTPLGSVVLRILQQSLMEIPDPRNAEDTPNGPRVLSESPLNRLAKEYRKYQDLKGLQGSVIPYCLGLHEIKMRNGEMACALILEHVEGETLSHWFDNRTTNGLLPPVDQEWVDQASEEVLEQHENALRLDQQRKGAHTSIAFEPPNVKWTQYLTEAKQLVLILFDTLDNLRTRGTLLDFRKEDLVITTEHDKPKSIVVMQFQTRQDSSESLEDWKKQTSLLLSALVDCCNTHQPYLLAWGEQERRGFTESLPWVEQNEVAKPLSST